MIQMIYLLVGIPVTRTTSNLPEAWYNEKSLNLLVYCLLVNRVQFLREHSYQAHHQSVNVTRANLCEILASRVLRRFDEDHTGREGLLLLANILVAGFEPFQNAPPEINYEKRTSNLPFAEYFINRGRERLLTAFEVAIVSESKMFLSVTACQKVVDAVWRGRITYTPTAWLDLVPDRYKHRGISLYDPRRAPLLNQYRLIVPRTRNFMETIHFAILFVLYVLAMSNKAHTIGPSHLQFTASELVFAVYSMGWALDEFASVLEHGWTVHTENLWSFLDLTFLVIYSTYFCLRMHGLAQVDVALGKQALDVLALAAPVLLPRLAFCLMNESMLFIALRAMMADFLFLTLLAVWLFGGFLLAMRWLSESQDGFTSHSPVTIAKWYVKQSFCLRSKYLTPSQDDLRLVRPRRNRHPEVGRTPPRSRTSTNDPLRLPGQHALPNRPRRHAERHIQQARQISNARNPIPARRADLRGRQIRRAILLPTALQRPLPLRPAPPEIHHLAPLVPQTKRLLCPHPQRAHPAVHQPLRAPLSLETESHTESA